MMEWVLLVFLTSGDGSYVSKAAIPFATEAECTSTAEEMYEHNADGLFQDGICVTRAHYEGTAVMDNVPLD